MKKVTTLFALAAIAGGSALAVVESDNIVAYQDVQSASFKLVTPPFTQVGGGTSFTLADLKPVSTTAWNYNSDMIHCFSGPNRVFIATYLTAAQAQSIIDDSGIEGVDAVEGWYDSDDVGEWGELGTLRCYNSFAIPFGASGLAVQSSVGVRFVGEVKTEDQTLASASYRLVGNCSAANLTLADIKPASIAAWNYNSDMIHCYSGPNRLFIATYLTAAQAQSIIDDSGIEGVDAVEGWYDSDDVGEWGELGTLRCYNSTALDAGSGFAVQSAVGVIIPSALNQ